VTKLWIGQLGSDSQMECCFFSVIPRLALGYTVTCKISRWALSSV